MALPAAQRGAVRASVVGTTGDIGVLVAVVERPIPIVQAVFSNLRPMARKGRRCEGGRYEIHRRACLAASLLAAEWAAGNTGPFLVRYPNGDPAAKGVLARWDPSLRPAGETALRVVKEDLTIRFLPPARFGGAPAVFVQAGYTIENPADRQVEADFGFPILPRTLHRPTHVR